MSMPMRHTTSAPPFRDRMRQAYSNSPGPSVNNVMPHFSNSPLPHATFIPSKTNSKSTDLPKPPKPPEKPLMPYMRYSREVWDSVKAKNMDLKIWQIGKIIGKMWRELGDKERQVYNDAYEAEKIQYQESLKQYHNSPVYQNFLKEKQRAESMMEEEERNRARYGRAEPRVSIQPTDYEDTDGGMSIKHIAGARYHRNHTLISEIFSDSVVPDARTVVTTQRMSVLKKQVQSLMAHQQKLENELTEINMKFEAKKRKFMESSDEFHENLKAECEKKPMLTQEQFDEKVAKYKEEIKSKHSQLKEQHEKELVKRKEAALKTAEFRAQLEVQPTESQEQQIADQQFDNTKKSAMEEAMQNTAIDSSTSTVAPPVNPDTAPDSSMDTDLGDLEQEESQQSEDFAEGSEPPTTAPMDPEEEESTMSSVDDQVTSSDA